MESTLSIAVHGAAGRMGRALLRIAASEPSLFRVVAAIVPATSAMVGRPARDDVAGVDPGLRFTATIEDAARVDAILDFSSEAGFDAALAAAISRRAAFVSGTTGLSRERHAALARSGATIPVLWSANFSLGVAVLMRLAADAARVLADFDCEISESHHRGKKDAPSGTALALGRAIADARGLDLDRVARFARERAGAARGRDEIGFSAIRAGDIVGEHVVVFAGSGERIELAHRASDRDIFARGALAAARRIAMRTPGVYAMDDVIG